MQVPESARNQRSALDYIKSLLIREHVAALHVHTFECTHLQSIFNSIARNYPITATNYLATSFGKPPFRISCTANRSADQKAPFGGLHMSLPIETHLAKLLCLFLKRFATLLRREDRLQIVNWPNLRKLHSQTGQRR